MTLSSIELAQGGDVLSQAVRAIRRKRGLKTGEVAARMHMAQRSYEMFEAGGGRITLERIMTFSEATDSDPFALLLAVCFRSAQFAVDCADTKLAMIMVMSLQEFSDERGSDVAFLEPPNIIGAFQRLFKELGSKLDDNESFLAKWMDGRTGSISLGALSLRGLHRKKA